MMTEDKYEKLCRFCGLMKDSGKYLFNSESIKEGLLMKIKLLFPNDGDLISSEVSLPKFICVQCELLVNYFAEFCNTVRQVQHTLKEKIIGESIRKEAIDQGVQKKQRMCHTAEDRDKILPESDFTAIPIDSFVSTSEKKFACDMCNKSFNAKGHLNRHRLIHYGAKPYLCENCGAGFNQRSSLKIHTLIHRQSTPHQCSWCGQSFRHKSSLISHQTSIHGYTAERSNTYECDKCHKKFTNQAKYRRHYRSHSGEKPFVCGVCDKAFGQNANLKTHYKKHETQPYMFEDRTSDGNSKLMQELYDCEPLLENAAYEKTTTNEFTSANLELKSSDTSSGVYFDYMMYSDETNLYEATTGDKSSTLPTFATLNAAPDVTSMR